MRSLAAAISSSLAFFQLLVIRLRLRLFLLGVGQICFKAFLHLLEDAEDFARRRGEGTMLLSFLHEGEDLLLLMGREETVKLGNLLVETLLEIGPKLDLSLLVCSCGFLKEGRSLMVL